MRTLVLALSALGFLAVTVPSAYAAPHKDWVFKGKHYKHRKMSHGHWHYY